MSFNHWKLKDGRVIALLKPEELKDLPIGTVLYDIFGEQVKVGINPIDNDTRAGYLAYGPLVEGGGSK